MFRYEMSMGRLRITYIAGTAGVLLLILTFYSVYRTPQQLDVVKKKIMTEAASHAKKVPMLFHSTSTIKPPANPLVK